MIDEKGNPLDILGPSMLKNKIKSFFIRSPESKILEAKSDIPTPEIEKYAAEKPAPKPESPLMQLIEREDGFSFEDPLVDAAERGDFEQIALLLNDGYPAYRTGLYGATALMRAAYRGHLEIIKKLLEWGADVNAADLQGVTPLHLALEARHNKIAKFLIDQGAKIGNLKIDYDGLYYSDGDDVYYKLVTTDKNGCGMYTINSITGLAVSVIMYRTSKSNFTALKEEAVCP